MGVDSLHTHEVCFGYVLLQRVLKMKHEPTMTGYKLCRKCQNVLPVIYFSVEKKNKDGLAGSCRGCLNKKASTNKKKLIKIKLHHKFHDDLE